LAHTSAVEIVASVVFAIAVAHTFGAGLFNRLAHRHPRHAALLHLLGEVEVVFGLWALVLALLMTGLVGTQTTLEYLESRPYTEPLFVFVIMVMSASKPVMGLVQGLIQSLAFKLPIHAPMALLFWILFGVPLLGSFITEPAAMTLAALLLRDLLWVKSGAMTLRYAVLGVLFVNVSVGGTLTSFAAPPVLMVAHTWQWDMTFMLTHLGWRAALTCGFNALALVLIFRRELRGSELPPSPKPSIPAGVSAVHVLFLSGVVVFAHHPVVFLALFMFFLGYTVAYSQHQSPLILREALLVAFFLAGLVVLGGWQTWWLKPLLLDMSDRSVFYGATLLTAVTDNAALTYLGSLVDGLSPGFKLSLVAGAVTGGGLTLIANAPNPAGAAILKGKFKDQTINPLGLLLAATPPTCVAIFCMRWL
jgi:Putative Na+/H+ antiporter